MTLSPRMAEIAREAGALLMEYFQQHVKIEYKGDADLVTDGRSHVRDSDPGAHQGALAQPRYSW